MEWEYIKLEVENSLGIITINRPKSLNALNSALLQELTQVVQHIKENQTIKVVIVTGAGEKAFVAGADIAEMKDLAVVDARKFSALGQQAFNELENLPQPVIAAINGFALGGGCELALACDIRLACHEAKLGQPEVGLGIIAGFAGTQRLPRIVGAARAKELLYTGKVISAQEAVEYGLVNKVVAKEELLEEAKDIANSILKNSQVAVRLTKEAINRGRDLEQAQGVQLEADLFALAFSQEDQREGMEAFLSKRKPNFA